MQQGTYVAKEIVRKLQRETEIKPFKYFDKRRHGRHRPMVCGGEYLRRPYFGFFRVDHLGVHSS